MSARDTWIGGTGDEEPERKRSDHNGAPLRVGFGVKWNSRRELGGCVGRAARRERQAKGSPTQSVRLNHSGKGMQGHTRLADTLYRVCDTTGWGGMFWTWKI